MDYYMVAPSRGADGGPSLVVAPRCHDEMSGRAWELHCDLEAEIHRAEFNLREAADVAKGLGCPAVTQEAFRDMVIELDRLGCVLVGRGVNANGDCRFSETGTHDFDYAPPSEMTIGDGRGNLFTIEPTPRVPMPTTDPLDVGVVYVLGSPASRLVKIGHSGRLSGRVGDIRRMCPVPLSVLWTYPGGKVLEGMLHRDFKAFRRHGEWFDFGEINPVAAVAADVAWLMTDNPDWDLVHAELDEWVAAQSSFQLHGVDQPADGRSDA